MQYEAALALRAIGDQLPVGHPERTQYLSQAQGAFSSLGARYDEARTARALEGPAGQNSTPAPISIANC